MATASSSLALALLFASLLSSMVCGESTIPMLERFQAWQATYNRTYAALDEFQRRFEVYSENLEFIEATNLLERPYELGENQFADLTYEEFQDTYLMKLDEEASALDPTPEAMGQLDNTMNAVEAPNSVDWRTKGAVTPVKDQKQCGSCWAFAAVASIEGVHKIRTGRLVSLSEQEIVDCDRGGDDHGCQGGYPSSAMAWVARNRGLTAESDYPYTGRQGRQCRRGKLGHHAATIRGARAVPRNNEAALERAVAGRPVAVLIDASRAFQFYRSGVLSGPCGTSLNHAVTVVGYGGAGGRRYWTVKNSWGRTWGENGYVRMQRRVRAREGMCGIAMAPYYPVMGAPSYADVLLRWSA
ncbi:unnamed protein product [Urochloa humidicola]